MRCEKVGPVARGLYLLVHYLIHVIAMRKYQVYNDEMDTLASIEYRSCVTQPVHALLSHEQSITTMFWFRGSSKAVFNDE